MNIISYFWLFYVFFTIVGYFSLGYYDYYKLFLAILCFLLLL